MSLKSVSTSSSSGQPSSRQNKKYLYKIRHVQLPVTLVSVVMAQIFVNGKCLFFTIVLSLSTCVRTYMYNSSEDTHLSQWNGKFLFQNVDWDSPAHLHSSCSDTDLSLWEWHVVPKSVNGDRDFFHWNSCISHYQLLVVAETLLTGMPFVVCASPNVHTMPEHTQLHWLPDQAHIIQNCLPRFQFH